MNRKIIVVLPAYNEEANIRSLLERIEAAMEDARLPYEIVVVDDGSRDATPAILEQMAARLPLAVTRHGQNQGLAAAIRDGLTAAAGRAGDGDIVVTMDADESHSPGLIPRMVQMVREGHDVVIASRYQRGGRVCGVPLARRFLSYGASWLFRILFPTAGVKDYTCGYRAYRAPVLKAALARYGDRFIDQEGFQCMADIILKLRRMGVIFGEAPMVLRYDLKESQSKMRVGATVGRTLSLLARRRLGG